MTGSWQSYAPVPRQWAISAAPGLRAFHLGAFAIAVEAGVPVVPTGIDGTRTVLRPDQRFPRRRPAQLGEHLRRRVRILDNAGAVALVTVPAGRGLARLLRAHAGALRHVVTPDDLSGGAATGPRPSRRGSTPWRRTA